MSKLPVLTGPSQDPASGGVPEQLVVMVHGVGADGNDLIGLAPQWATLLPDAEFVAPHAPYPYDMAPSGHQWFSVADRSPDKILAGARDTAPIVEAFIDSELKRTGLTADRLALVGFSQGTMMSLHVGPRRRQRLAGVLGYSGLLVGPETLAGELASKPPILLIHGDSDDVVPLAALHKTVAALAAAEVPARWHICQRLGH
ncbi:MAG: prolyl oligopeptidase family serine peptidase, partial [Proteobacteria bacterium]|nr:prolyl oligopeptidase family serine peptidase [Pseudomonadota bacterium]